MSANVVQIDFLSSLREDLFVCHVTLKNTTFLRKILRLRQFGKDARERMMPKD